MTAKKYGLLIAGLAAAAAAILFIRGADDGYRQLYERHYKAALPGLVQKAENGDDFAAYLLGRSHRQGHGVPIDSAKAHKWFLKSARLGNIDGAAMVAQLIYEARNLGAGGGRGREFCAWYVKVLDMAARLGSLQAADRLGKNYARGACVPKSQLESHYYFTLARNIDKSLGVRLAGKKPLGAEDQKILRQRLAAKDAANTDARLLAYFLSTFETYK